MHRVFRFAFGILASLVATAAGAEPISLHGSTTVMNLLVQPHKARIEAISGQEITIFGNGSQRGLADLIAGKAQIAMISAPLDLEVGKLDEMPPGSIDLAEGIETGEELECLRREGCTEAQGYYFSRPVPASDVYKLLTKHGISVKAVA
jgi:hypothetical protein